MSKNIKKLLSGQMTLTKGDLSFVVNSTYVMQSIKCDLERQSNIPIV